jgi:hypothetical protein
MCSTWMLELHAKNKTFHASPPPPPTHPGSGSSSRAFEAQPQASSASRGLGAPRGPRGNRACSSVVFQASRAHPAWPIRGNARLVSLSLFFGGICGVA